MTPGNGRQEEDGMKRNIARYMLPALLLLALWGSMALQPLWLGIGLQRWKDLGV